MNDWVPLKNILHVLVAGFGKICLYAIFRCFKFIEIVKIMC